MPACSRVFALTLLLALAGCGAGSFRPPVVGSTYGSAIRGHVLGGQQPVSAAKIYLYAVSSSADGGASTSLLTSLVPGQPGYVLTDINGNWSITGDYTCPASSSVYLLSIGGNPGLSGIVGNSQLVLAAGLGSCSSLSASSFFTINEITTAMMAYGFAGFESSPTQIGSATPGNITNAFSTINAYVDIVHGFAKSALPASDTIRQTIDSFAASLAYCVNSSGNGGACSTLFADTAVNGSTPSDTFTAAINIAQNPTNNVAAIYGLGAANGPFQPTLAQAPATWSLYTAASFFSGQIALGNGLYSVPLSSGAAFGPYSYLADPHYVNNIHLGEEYVTDAADQVGGVYFYDVTSGHTWYTSPSLYPYLYDFSFGSYIYYFEGSQPREFYNLTTGTYVSF